MYHSLAEALLDSTDITLSNIPCDNEYPEVWIITHNLAYSSIDLDFLICRAKYKSMPDSSIIIGKGHCDSWNKIANHIYMLLLNKDTDTICDNLDDDNIARNVSDYIENDAFFIDLIDNAVDVDGEKYSILLTNYIENDAILEMFGKVVNACINDYFNNKG